MASNFKCSISNSSVNIKHTNVLCSLSHSSSCCISKGETRNNECNKGRTGAGEERLHLDITTVQ